QAEDGIRDFHVTGVQTCALPILMVLTLWFSKKARTVADTEIDLSRQGEGSEKFTPNALSRVVVKAGTQLSLVYSKVLPVSLQKKIGRASCRERVRISASARTAQE